MAGIKTMFKNWMPAGSTGRWILSGMYLNPTQFLFSFLKSLKLTHKLTGSYFPVKVIIGAGQKLYIFCSSKSNVLIKENIFVNRWGVSNLPSSISYSNGSTLRALRDFEIESDSIIAWDVFVADPNWHDIQSSERFYPVTIGDNVWIAHVASVMKGAEIPSGCIVGAKPLLSRGNFPEKSLFASVPTAVCLTEVVWSR